MLDLTDVLLLVVVVCLIGICTVLVALRGAVLSAIDAFRPRDAQPGPVPAPKTGKVDETKPVVPVFVIYREVPGEDLMLWQEIDPTAAARRVIAEKRGKFTGSLEMNGDVVRRWKDGVERESGLVKRGGLALVGAVVADKVVG